MKTKFYIVYDYKMTDEIELPNPWGTFPHAIHCFLREELNVNTIGAEIKWIIDWNHRQELIKDHNVTSENLDDYVKAKCSLFSFKANGTRKRAVKELEKRGAKSFVLVDNYRDAILTQAHFYNYKKFPTNINKQQDYVQQTKIFRIG